jgi:hypothetical protein
MRLRMSGFRCEQIHLWLLPILIVAALQPMCLACSSFGNVHTCDHLQAEAVFVGTVTSIVPMTRTVNGQPWPGYYMTFAVREILKGKIGQQVEVGTNQGGGDCGTPLKPGERYLIFAEKGPEGKLWTGLGSGNEPLPEDADVEGVVGPVRQAITVGKGSVYGTVTYETPTAWDKQGKTAGGGTRAASNLLLTASSATNSFTTHVGEDGKYEFKNLPNGKYTVTPEAKQGWTYDQHWFAERYERSVSDGSCARVEFQLQPTTRLQGQITIPKGEQFGVPDAGTVDLQTIVAIPVGMQLTNDRSGVRATVYADGHFEFWPIAPGDYYVGINISSSPTPQAPYSPTYYPGATDKKAARVVHIEEGETKSIELPPPGLAVERTVHLVAIGLDGKPLPKIRVQREDLEHPGDAINSTVDIDLDANGAGMMTVYAGIAYHLHASYVWLRRSSWCAAPVMVPAGSAPVDARFVMDRSNSVDEQRAAGRYRSNCDIVVVDSASNNPSKPSP